MIIITLMFGGLATQVWGNNAASSEQNTSAPNPRATIDRRLDVAAPSTERVTQSVMLAVTSAGHRTLAAGERGLIVYSDDCGVSWRQARVPVGVSLTALSFADEKHGWAVGHGGVVLSTQDAGETWQKQIDGRAVAQLAYAAAKARSTADPGEAAERDLRDADRLLTDGPDKPLFAVHFWSPKRGMVVGAYGLALATEDGGAHWQWIAGRIPNPRGLHLFGLLAQGNEVYVVGEQGFVAHSDDGGRSFQSIVSPYPGSYFGIAGISRDQRHDVVIYGLRGHMFRLSTQQAPAFEQLNVGAQSSVLTLLPLSSGKVLAFDADGKLAEIQDVQMKEMSVDSSPVGPVLGAVQACGGVVVAGMRGLSVIHLNSTVAATSGKGSAP